MVETTLNLALLDTHTYTINPDYDGGLQRLAAKLMEVSSVPRSELSIDRNHSLGKGQSGRRAPRRRQGSRTRHCQETALGKPCDLWILLQADQGCMFSNAVFSRLASWDAKAISKSEKYIELGTIKSGVYFTTKTLKSLATDYQEPNEEYQHTQSGLVKEVVNIACEYPALQTAA